MFLHLSVSHSVHGGGDLGRYPSLGQVHSLGRYTPGQLHPLGSYTPQASTTPTNACWDTVNKRAVRNLLECILVKFLTPPVEFFSFSCSFRQILAK